MTEAHPKFHFDEPDASVEGRTLLGVGHAGAAVTARMAGSSNDRDTRPEPPSGALLDDTRPGHPGSRAKAQARASDRPHEGPDTQTTARDAAAPVSGAAAEPPAAPARDTLLDGPSLARDGGHPTLAGRFRLLSVLGRGPFGTVYEAEDRELDAFVAVKVLPERLSSHGRIMERVRKQLSRARSIVHPNVARLFDVNRDGDVHFVVMEYVPGRTLGDEIRAGLPPETVRTRLLQLLDALQAIHAAGLVHGAVDASHIRIAPSGMLKLTSTCLSCELLHGTEFHPPDHRCESPEQKAGQHATVRSDIYAAGRVMTELLEGCTTPAELAFLRDIAARCLEGNPASRFASIPAILEEFERSASIEANRLPAAPVSASAALPSVGAGFEAKEIPVATAGLFTVAVLRGVRRLWRMSIPLPLVVIAVLLYVLLAEAKDAVVAAASSDDPAGTFLGWFSEDAPEEGTGVTPLAAPKRAPHREHRAKDARAASPAPTPAGTQAPGPTEAPRGMYFYETWKPVDDAVRLPSDTDRAGSSADSRPASGRHTHAPADAYRVY